MSGISTSAFQQFAGAGAGQTYIQKTLPLTAIDPHPENRPIDARKVEELAATIERDGLGQLPLVRAMPNGRYQMISGHHRLEAFRLLAQRDGDKWKSVPVNVIRDCDDDRALCLLHMTNLAVAGLDKTEAGRAYEAIAQAVMRARRANPAIGSGVRTNRIVAEISAEQGRPVSETYVRTARKAYREASSGQQVKGGRPRGKAERPTEAQMAADALQRAIERLEALDAPDLRPVTPRLARYGSRLRALAREVAK